MRNGAASDKARRKNTAAKLRDEKTFDASGFWYLLLPVVRHYGIRTKTMIMTELLCSFTYESKNGALKRLLKIKDK